jgi:hypothetical protein
VKRISVVLLGTLIVGIPAIFVSSTNASARMIFETLPLIGGATSGSTFTRRCPDNHVLTGLRWRKGLVLDGVGIKCRPVSSSGLLGTESNYGTMAGGNGGTAGSDGCGPANVREVVAGQRGGSGGVGVAGLVLECYEWAGSSKSWGGGTPTSRIEVLYNAPQLNQHRCADAKKPAVGITGRHGSIIDAVGLICDTP